MAKGSGVLTPLFLAFMAPAPSLAWGPTGHEVVAYIAEDNLTPAARAAVAGILPAGEDLADVANWADEIREERKSTAPWHFIDLPDRQKISETDENNFCPGSGCVVDQIEGDEKELTSTSQGRAARFEALKFLVHFVGDIHQPLHCDDDSDRGGNEKVVRFKTPGRRGRGSRIKLHALWDHLIETKPKEDPRALASKLELKITTTDKTNWSSSSPEDWAFESYEIAKTKIYPGFNPGPGDYSETALPVSYYYQMRPIMDEQLEKAGIRLAVVLNKIFQ